jgi:predicted ferric reductase
MNHEFWYLSRAAGFVAYLLLFISVVLGMATGTRLLERFVRRNIVFDLHRFTTLLALAFTLFHVYILLGDGYFSFNVWELSLPFRSPYRTWQTAVGVFALYALVLVTVSFYVRRFVGYRVWRTLHYLTFALFAGALLHSITAGTDTTLGWAQLIYAGTGLVTLAVIAYRLQYNVPQSELVRGLRVASGAATALVALVLLAARRRRHAGQPAESDDRW